MRQFRILTGFTLAVVFSVPAFSQDAVTATDPSAGYYDALSPGEKSIVDAIYESHLEATASETTTTQTTGNGSETTDTMTPDDIAALKADGGWGKTYNQLYSEGKVAYRNLGQAISAHKRSLNPSSSGTTTVVTAGGGQQVVTGGKKSGGSASASANGGKQPGSEKFGHNKPTVVTSAGGGTTFSGAAAHSNSGGVSGVAGAAGANGRGHGGGSHK